LAVQFVAAQRVDVGVGDGRDAGDGGVAATMSGCVWWRWSIEAVM